MNLKLQCDDFKRGGAVASAQRLRPTCSSQLTENSLYYEKTDNEFGRPYNAYFKKKALNCEGTVFQIIQRNANE